MKFFQDSVASKVISKAHRDHSRESGSAETTHHLFGRV